MFEKTLVFRRGELKWYDFETYKRLGYDHIVHGEFLILFKR